MDDGISSSRLLEKTFGIPGFNKKIHLAVVLAFFVIFGVFFLSFCSWKRDLTQICYSLLLLRNIQPASTEHHPILFPGKQVHGLYKQSF
jgi:hypothetical protein